MSIFKTILRKVKNRFNHYYYKNKKFNTEDEFYTYLFTKDPSWNCAGPNEDERIRLAEINQAIKGLKIEKKIDILEVGCGRGWLCNELSVYGKTVGIEPVAPVIKYAKKMFPALEFYAELPGSFIEKFPNKKFDLIVSTEVLEHVKEKDLFMKQIQTALKPNGVIIITTPRMEIYDDFVAVYGNEPGQPVEEWMFETEVEQLLLNNNFEVIARKAFGPIASKNKDAFTTQMWVFKNK